MLPNLIEYHRPTTMSGALRLLARRKVRTVPLAGGTALVPSRDPSVEALVDLSALNLAGIQWRTRRVHIGAMTTLQTLASNENVQRYANGLLAEAARVCVTRNLRNVATVGGTLVAGGPACDLLVALLALDARVTVHVRRVRTLALADFLTAPYEYLDGGIVTHIAFPFLKIPHGAALARIARTPNDAAIVNAVALVVPDGGTCKQVRLALGGVAPRAVRIASVELELEGHAWDDVLVARVVEQITASLTPPSDHRASSEYRREMAAIVAQRALEQAWRRAQGDERWKSK